MIRCEWFSSKRVIVVTILKHFVIYENKTRTYYLLYSIGEFFTKWSRIQ